LLARFGGGLCAPSANRSGYVSPVSAEHVLADYTHDALAVLDGGVCPRGIESTIVRPRGERLEILRPGALSLADLQRAWGGPVEYIGKPEIAVPGSAPRHYAPRTPTRLLPRERLHEAGEGAAVIVLAPVPPLPSAVRVACLPREAGAYAARLYSTLRELDVAGCTEIVIEQVPGDSDWLALANRLGRAACPE